MRTSTYASIIALGAYAIHFHTTLAIALVIAVIAGIVEDRHGC